EIVLDKIGPVRAIVHTGQGPFRATTFACGSYMETATHLDIRPILDELPIIPNIDSIRFSMDLTSAANGATYYNETAPGGVTVNGSPDAVPGTPFTQGWRQISLANATTVQVYSFEGDLQANMQH